MTRSGWVAVGLICALFLLGFKQKDTIVSLTITDKEALGNANVQAFLRALRAGESSQGSEAYNMLVYGGTFSDMSTHPNVRKPIPGVNNFTTAAGAYQITYSTWKWLRLLAGVSDFTPASQDKMAVAYLRRLGALKDIIDGRYSAAVEKSSKVWEAITVPRLRQRMDVAYRQFGGTLT